MTFEIRNGDALELMGHLAPGSVDAVVTDPPYALAFMGKAWDTTMPGVETWAEALRVAKPGAHLVAFGGTRTYHRLAVAIEDAGWEIRDCLMWLYGSGFPKSLDVSKAIDKAAGAQRAVVGPRRYADGTEGHWGLSDKFAQDDHTRSLSAGTPKLETAPATDAARAWAGWGTALKPAWEPIILARKPLVGTVAANVQAHGTGALNIDACRIGTDTSRGERYNGKPPGGGGTVCTGGVDREQWSVPAGRWPANVVLDEEAAAILDEQSGEQKDGTHVGRNRSGEKPASVYGKYQTLQNNHGFGGAGGASRFFYTSKSSSAERHYAGKNTHPTVKPVDLMAWLCKLVTPPGGLILDPFMGSGSTGVAALSGGFRFIGFDREADYCAIARRRIAGPLFAADTEEQNKA